MKVVRVDFFTRGLSWYSCHSTRLAQLNYHPNGLHDDICRADDQQTALTRKNACYNECVHGDHLADDGAPPGYTPPTETCTTRYHTPTCLRAWRGRAQGGRGARRLPRMGQRSRCTRSARWRARACLLGAVSPEHARAARRKCGEQRRPQAGRGQELGNTAVRRMRRAGRVGDAGRRGRTSVRAHTHATRSWWSTNSKSTSKPDGGMRVPAWWRRSH